MRLLLDTHIVLWMATDRSLLSPGEIGAIIDPDNDLAVSAVSIIEFRMKWNSRHSSGVRKGPIDPRRLLSALDSIEQAVESLQPTHAAAELTIPLNHGDPFDALLLAVAQETNRRLLTRDAALRDHPLACFPG